MSDNTCHLSIRPGKVAVVTGGASGIGLAAARYFAAAGMKLCIGDINANAFQYAATELASIATQGASDICVIETDVASTDDINRLAEQAFKMGQVSVLMNNAAAFKGGDPLSNPDAWRRLIDVNVVGVLNGIQSIAIRMIDQKIPGVVINTGSKQGLTSPPGDFAYNVTKAAVKTMTEALAHTLRNRPDCQITAHLLTAAGVHLHRRHGCAFSV